MQTLLILKLDGSLVDLVRKRYQRYYSGIVALIEAEKEDFETLEKKVLEWGEPTVASGKQVSVALNLSHVMCDLICLLALLMVLKFHCLPNLQYSKGISDNYFGTKELKPRVFLY